MKKIFLIVACMGIFSASITAQDGKKSTAKPTKISASAASKNSTSARPQKLNNKTVVKKQAVAVEVKEK